MNNMNNVTTGNPKVSGAIFIDITGKAQLPTDGVKELDSNFKDLGYSSSNGVEISEERSVEEKTAWGGDVISSAVTKYYEKVKFTPVETNEAVLQATYGKDNVEVKSDEKGNQVILAKHTGATLPPRPMVIETVAAENIIKRYVMPRVQLDKRGAAKLNGKDNDGRELEFKALPDEHGVTMYEYTTILKAAE